MRLISLLEYDHQSHVVSDKIPHPKNKWIPISRGQLFQLKDEFYDLIQHAYKDIGGHSKLKSGDDILKETDWTHWMAIDIDDDPYFDLVVFGQQTKFGIKSAGVGHDGSKAAKSVYLNQKAQDSFKIGNYGEISGDLAAIMITKFHVPIVTNKEEIEDVLGEKRK